MTSGQTKKDRLWLFLFLPVFLALQMKKESGVVKILLTKFRLGLPRFPPSSSDGAPHSRAAAVQPSIAPSWWWE